VQLAHAWGELNDQLTVRIAVVRSSFGFEKRFALTQLTGAKTDIMEIPLEPTISIMRGNG
jgi:hypothetical protein